MPSSSKKQTQSDIQWIEGSEAAPFVYEPQQAAKEKREVRKGYRALIAETEGELVSGFDIGR